MSILIFVVILAVLIVVHEFGHFLVAKFFGIRVDEFGIGYPPKAFTFFTWRGTRFTFNWLPFGGFVKIFGENGLEKEVESGDPSVNASGKNFMDTPRSAQALVLLAGVTFNVVFAWLLISLGFMIGMPTSLESIDNPGQVSDARLLITAVSSDSPASLGGLKSGDSISRVYTATETASDLSPSGVSTFISGHGEEKIHIEYVREEETGVSSVTPADGIVEGKKAVGISMSLIGTVSLPVHKAVWQGAKTTLNLTKLTAVGLATFIYDAVRGSSDFSEVTGPVGIVGLVGDASRLGFIYLISFTAFISINLAVINLVPFPALDGGRLLFVIIEAIKRSPISPAITVWSNAIGFILLIGLMVVVTISDVLKLI